MAYNLHSTGNGHPDFKALANPVYQGLRRFAVLTRMKTKSALRALQTARMLSVLANMSDQQLAQIGISRSEIPQYADRLMSEV